ncbi:hypothetical protein PC118_g17022 [Phytophthora cactorum]|nr:hypothetical protein PC112_g10806 [Phytophthora cactorum]KAG2825398.1 hypothetical protein PC111_g9419 [Phytophthora cactorum]KAG2970184.1 hypothetical protein PC118_g17022 [Phytophthora cactorum]KAG3010172.1 hypothetical protein PC120_g15199 [Phytophthora cactorum]KAG3016913.1 hypothetical protein PC119_g11191 [Phytophthora cactorum]
MLVRRTPEKAAMLHSVHIQRHTSLELRPTRRPRESLTQRFLVLFLMAPVKKDQRCNVFLAWTAFDSAKAL